MERILIDDPSEIIIRRGWAGDELLPVRPDRERVAIFTQPGAAHIAAAVLAGISDVETHQMTLPDRDAAKTLAVVQTAYEWLAETGIGRHDTIVGVGGGAATDVTGFVAATYLRGVELVQVPTTLLGAVDAAIGGKTGVNLGGKNLVGAFYHPRRIIIDLEIAESLPTDLKREGLAEALKAGLVADPELFSHIEQTGLAADLEVVVPRAVAVKTNVVKQDFRETGIRAILNYGHTIGHAVEIITGLPHGHAIALGMAAAGRIGEDLLGFDSADRQRNALIRLGLPVWIDGPDRRALLDVLVRDKKRDASGIRMVLLRSIGDPMVVSVPMEAIHAGLAGIGIG